MKKTPAIGRPTVKASSARLARHASLHVQNGESATSGVRLGVVENFRIGDCDSVDQVLGGLRALGVADLRTMVSWADWESPEGEAWYSWLLPRLASEVNLIPCVLYTPLSQAVAPRVGAPPWDPKAYGDFLDILITRLGHCFEWLELWNEPDRLGEWDRTLATWRKECWPYYEAVCRQLGRVAALDMPLVCERMRVVWRAVG